MIKRELLTLREVYALTIMYAIIDKMSINSILIVYCFIDYLNRFYVVQNSVLKIVKKQIPNKKYFFCSVEWTYVQSTLLAKLK
jgi:hypothetical protein